MHDGSGRSPTRARTIDHDLAYLGAEWRSIPDVGAEWSTCEEPERLDFVVEWPIRQDRLNQRRRWADEGLLEPDQHAQLRELEALVMEYDHILAHLLAD